MEDHCPITYQTLTLALTEDGKSLSRYVANTDLGAPRRGRIFQKDPHVPLEVGEAGRRVVDAVLLQVEGEVVVQSRQRLLVLLELAVVPPAARLYVQLRQAPEVQLLPSQRERGREKRVFVLSLSPRNIRICSCVCVRVCVCVCVCV